MLKDKTMKLTFKEVGQGDSILLEWEEGSKRKMGIIDCNRTLRKNPVLEYIQGADYREIEFIILSHPHRDHFSGMVELLNYLELAKISVYAFGHTLHLLGNDYYQYLDTLEPNSEDKRALSSLFNKVSELRNVELIKKISFISDGTLIPIKKGVDLLCLSPGRDEAKLYMSAVDYDSKRNKNQASQKANHLSTIFALQMGEEYHLLTSDGEVPSFERIMKDRVFGRLLENKLSLCQIPHHGSVNNHYLAFWERLATIQRPNAIISSGLHEKYRLPHLEVVEAFAGKGYHINATNIVYGMAEYVSAHSDAVRVADLTEKLDTTFIDFEGSFSGGDKVFELA